MCIVQIKLYVQLLWYGISWSLQYDSNMKMFYIQFTKIVYLFRSIIGFSLIFIGMSTFYDLFTSMSSFEHFQFTGKPVNYICVHWKYWIIYHITEKSKKHLILQSFSLSKNVRKLLTFPKTSDNLECIHGLKFISMCFIIVGHRFMFSLGSPIMNTNFIEYVSYNYLFIIL